MFLLCKHLFSALNTAFFPFRLGVPMRADAPTVDGGAGVVGGGLGVCWGGFSPRAGR